MSELSDLVRGVVALEPDSQAFEFRGEWRTWGSVAQGMAAIDAALRELGFGAGVRVGVLLKNHGDLPPVVLEVVCSQRCLVTLNGASPPQRLVEEIDKLAPRAGEETLLAEERQRRQQDEKLLEATEVSLDESSADEVIGA